MMRNKFIVTVIICKGRGTCVQGCIGKKAVKNTGKNIALNNPGAAAAALCNMDSLKVTSSQRLLGEF